MEYTMYYISIPSSSAIRHEVHKLKNDKRNEKKQKTKQNNCKLLRVAVKATAKIKDISARSENESLSIL